MWSEERGCWIEGAMPSCPSKVTQTALSMYTAQTPTYACTISSAIIQLFPSYPCNGLSALVGRSRLVLRLGLPDVARAAFGGLHTGPLRSPYDVLPQPSLLLGLLGIVGLYRFRPNSVQRAPSPLVLLLFLERLPRLFDHLLLVSQCAQRLFAP